MEAVQPTTARQAGIVFQQLENRGVGGDMVKRTMIKQPDLTAALLKIMDTNACLIQDVIQGLSADPELFTTKIDEIMAELAVRPRYGDWLLRKLNRPVVKNGRQGPNVPDDFDPAMLCPISFLRPGEVSITGNEMQRRAVEELSSPYGRKFLWKLLNRQELIPMEWKSIDSIVFAGDYDLVDPNGGTYTLCLVYREDGWSWRSAWLGNNLWYDNTYLLKPCST